MATSHKVKQGEHLAKIAKKFGFRSPFTIWDDPGNAALKALRKNPNVLLPGDVVFIPDKQVRDEAAETGQRHTFHVVGTRLRLRLVLEDHFGDVIAGLDGALDVQGDERPVTSRDDGLIQRDIPVDAHDGELSILGAVLPVAIGDLDPVDAQSGWQARLNNLGYEAGSIGEAAPDELRSALEEFQCDVGLLVTGKADDPTRAALLTAHRC